MPQAPSSRQKLVRIAQSLLIGAIGGFLFNAAKFPAGWLAGSMVFAAAAALAGRPIQVPSALARVCSVVLGIAIGGVGGPPSSRRAVSLPPRRRLGVGSLPPAPAGAFSFL